MNILLKRVFGDYLADEIPNLIAFFSSQKSESTRLVNTKEVHPIDCQVLFGKLKVKCPLALFFHFSGDHTKRKTTFFSTVVWDVIESEEGPVAC